MNSTTSTPPAPDGRPPHLRTRATSPRADWLSVAQACEHIGVSRATLYRLIDEGMPAHSTRTGGRRLFDRSEVDAWLRNRCSERAASQAVA